MHKKFRIFRICAATLLLNAALSAAQTYPAKPLRVVVPYPAGGGVDITGRAIAQKLAEALGQSVIVDNRPGATGTVGTDYVAKSAPDGYTLLVAGRGPIAAAHLMNPPPPYVSARDLAPISNLVSWPYILVAHPSVPARNARELIAIAKAKPGVLNMVSGGAGSGQHIAGELFNMLAGTRMTHIPYKGTAPAITDLMGGHADLGFLDPAVLPQILSGRLKALGVSGDTVYPPLPAVPTISQTGLPAFVTLTWYGLFTSAGTPREIINRLNAETVRALAQPDVKAKLLTQGLIATSSTPEHLAADIRADNERLTKLVKATGIQLN
ncbi:MAG: tripartite tricarboxylate transporter substrate binding protein [Betaproteobacteria bacterium]|nr:tripartite tricarboxylate transporter substrate binding protein [Betaproteobacteria bacterium]